MLIHLFTATRRWCHFLCALINLVVCSYLDLSSNSAAATTRMLPFCLRALRVAEPRPAVYISFLLLFILLYSYMRCPRVFSLGRRYHFAHVLLHVLTTRSSNSNSTLRVQTPFNILGRGKCGEYVDILVTVLARRQPYILYCRLSPFACYYFNK